jgi:putative ATP-dependent endonuclease of the OLD family
VKLIGFGARHFRNLNDVREFSIAGLNVFTGCNDGGKSSALAALEFLLDPDRSATVGDFTSPPAPASRQPRLDVFGVFETTPAERARHPELPVRLEVTRSARRSDDGAVTESYEATLRVAEIIYPDLDAAGEDELRSFAGTHGIDPDQDILSLRSAIAVMEAQAPRKVRTRALPDRLRHLLPRIVAFSSSRPFDPESHVREALEFVLDRKSREIETSLKSATDGMRELIDAATVEMRDHVSGAYEDIKDLSISAEFDFIPSLGRVAIDVTDAEGKKMALTSVGMGRQRRVSFALWESSTEVRSRVADGDERGVILTYDEPEIHLDFARQREFMEKLQSRLDTDARVQAVVATHSLAVIDRVAPEAIVDFQLDPDGFTRIRTLGASDSSATATDHMTTIALHLGITNSAWLTRKLFVFAEGPTELKVLPQIFLKVTGDRPQRYGIEVISLGGNAEVSAVLDRIRHFGLAYHFIIDSDTLLTDGLGPKFTAEHLQRKGVDSAHVTALGLMELEDLFNDELWARTANRHWTRVDGQSWTAQVFAALRAQDKFSSGVRELVNSCSGLRRGKPDLMEGVIDVIEPAEMPGALVTLCETLRERAKRL